jgi:putative acetyltransferase
MEREVESMLRLVEADTPEMTCAAAGLFREYAGSLPFSLDYQGFEEELAGLPGRYARPTGVLLLAFVGEELAGCAALREIELAAWGRVCEMKRLYVRPRFRGRGIGRLLAERIVEEGQRLGYAGMRLDTSEDMSAARRVYEGLGFYRIDRYNSDPMEDTLFFERRF